MGIRRGRGGGPMLAVLAHLDTVFPEGTDVKVRREGTRLMAPGVGDDTRGLALMLSVIRAMNAAKLETRSDILFVGNVGEEGEGDLRGVKYLLRKGKYKDRIKLFLAIDGGEQGTITRGGVGSKRYRVDVQRSRRAQLWRLRTGQPRLRHGRSYRPLLRRASAASAKDDVQRRRVEWRDVGQLDSCRSEHGRGHPIRVLRRAREGRRDVSLDRQERGRRREQGALHAGRANRGRPTRDWRTALRRNVDGQHRS